MGEDKLRESQYPTVTDDSFIDVECWSDILREEELKALVKFGLMDAKKPNAYNGWFKESKKHLYSIWREGEIPQQQVKDLALRFQHLHETDAANSGMITP